MNRQFLSMDGLGGWQRPLRVTAVFLVLTFMIVLTLFDSQSVLADGIPTIVHMPLYARTGNTDTPFAIYLTVSGLNENTSYEFTARINHGGTDRGSFTTGGSFGTSYLALGTTVSGCGTNCSLSRWAYLRASNTVPVGASNIRLRIRVVGAGTPSPADLTGPTFLDMTTTGGWIEESIGTSRDGRAVAVYVGSNLIGLYVAEDNGVTDGYPNTPGYYRVAVPSCEECNYTIETWELGNPGTAVGQINTMGINGCPNSIGVGVVQSLNSCNTPTAVSLQSFSANGQSTPLLLVVGLLALLVGGTAVVKRKVS
ncbi:MAG: hypothetical protein IPM39_03475 [Chloroflexi bacterium]|nr:hypothetical protein [Chloroflexota bacterium]